MIIGLGNPGPEYKYTRHNLGFVVIQRLADQLKTRFALSSFTNAVVAKGKVEEEEVFFLCPLTFMNNSGSAVVQAVQKKGVKVSDILVVCDDLSLPFGQMRIKPQGSAGGHNGLKSIIEKLGTTDFPRLRIGIGRPKPSQEVAQYVLETFSKAELKSLPETVERASECCLVWLKEGMLKAMDIYNRNNLPTCLPTGKTNRQVN